MGGSLSGRVLRIGTIAASSVLAIVAVWAVHHQLKATPGVHEEGSKKLQCGHHAVIRCCQLLGVPITAEKVTALMPHEDDGHSFQDLANALRELGLRSEARRTTFDSLRTATAPVIAYFHSRHWITIADVTAERVVAYDQEGRRTQYTHKDFQRRWAGMILKVWRDGPPLGSAAGEEPCIQFDKLIVDKGDMSTAEPRPEYTFQFRNEGRRMLVINRVRANCSCVRCEVSRTTLGLGERGYLKVTLDQAKLAGPFVEDIVVLTNDPESPVVYLGVSGNVESELRMRPRRVEFGRVSVESNDPIVRTVIITSDCDASLDVERVCLVNDKVPVRVIVGRPLGRSEGQLGTDRWVSRNAVMLAFALINRPKTLGVFESRAVVSLRGVTQKAIEIPISAEVVPSVEALPRSLFFGEVRVGDRFEQRILVRSSSGKQFRVTSIDTEAFPMSVECAREPGKEAWIVFKGAIGAEHRCDDKMDRHVDLHYVLMGSDVSGVIRVPVYVRMRAG